ncbi:MAG: lectin-like protein, partial [Myxococcota bacterium]
TTTVPELCDGDPPGIEALTVSRRTDLVTTVDLAVTLDAEAALAVACTRAGRPDEVSFYTSASAVDHAIPLRGLAADSRYDCALIATCPASPAPVRFPVVTDALPDVMPEVAASTPGPTATTAPPFLLLGHDRHCVDGSTRMVAFDLDGEIRWYDEGVPDIDIAFETQYLGDGRFSWGGGYYDGYPPQIVTVDHQVEYTVDTPASQSHVFHHDGKVIDDGEILLMMIEEMTDGDQRWDGFAVGLVDPATQTDTYYYTAQTAVDAGDLPPGDGDPWHANWADYQHDSVNGDRLYVSLCNLGEIIAIDAATQQVLWMLGEGGDFEVRYPSGEPVPADLAYTQCQHGLEFVRDPGGGDGGTLLVYDNGVHGRGASRLAEYALDPTTGTATLNWGWTEPEWSEPAWGDADYLPGGHVLGTMGHSCWSRFPDDRSSVVEVDPVSGDVAWRLDFLDVNDAIYRSERVDLCDVFPISTLCPSAAFSLSELAPLFDPCGPGGTDVDQDGDGAFLCADLDCDDLDPAARPDAVEACDGVDNDCSGGVDEGFDRTDWYPDHDGDGVGGPDPVSACAAPPDHVASTGDCDDEDPAAVPGGVEACDAADNDCDGGVDELPSCWGCAEDGALLGCSTPLTWDDARQVCLDLGGDLASIGDGAENRAASALVNSQAWLGLTDAGSEGDFAWIAGDPVTYTRWAGGEPNDFGAGEDCAGIVDPSDGSWNDWACATELPFVCER